MLPAIPRVDTPLRPTARPTARSAPRVPTRPSGPRSSANVVAPQPVASAAFTWKRVAAFQCLAGDGYTLPEICVERSYLTKHAVAAIAAMATDLHTPKSTLLLQAHEVLLACCEDEEIEERFVLERVQYGQLTQCKKIPDLSKREPPANTLGYVPASNYESFNGVDGKKRFVQAPLSEGGWYAELTGDRSLKFRIELQFTLHLDAFCQDAGGAFDDELSYAFTLSFKQRGGDNLYRDGMTQGEGCTQLQLGHFNFDTDRLVAWPATARSTSIMLKDERISDMLFDQTKWPLHEEAIEEEEDAPRRDYLRPLSTVDEAEEADDDSSGDEMEGQFKFAVKNGQLCEVISVKKGEKKKRIATFDVVKVLQDMMFVEKCGPVMTKVLCRKTRPEFDNDRVVYIRDEDITRNPPLEDARFIDVEVVLTPALYTKDSDVATAFADGHCMLKTEKFTATKLNSLLNTMDMPDAVSCIVRWGMQSDGTFVLANCAFKDGILMRPEESGYGIASKYFTMQPEIPYTVKEFPRMVVIPFEHVRYTIGYMMFQQVWADFFCNNATPAFALFCYGVMGLNANLIWDGQTKIGHGFPLCWAWSHEQNSGKSEASLVVHHMLGKGHRGVTGGDVTKAGLFELLHLQSNMVEVVDDVAAVSINKKNAQQKGGDTISSNYAVIGRALYDHTSRTVCGRVRRPESSAIFSANARIIDDDKAFHSRMITIPFEALRADASEDDPDLYDNMANLRRMMSALLPDLSQIGKFNGKMDAPAFQDLAKYLQVCLKQKRNRNCNEWAKVMYYMLTVNALFQREDQLQEVFDFVLSKVSVAVKTLTAHSGLVDQFVVNVIQCIDKIKPDPMSSTPERCFYVHNLNQDATRDVPPAQRNEKWWAFLLGPCLTVIAKLTGNKLAECDLVHALKQCPEAISHGKATFFDYEKMPWPAHTALLKSAEQPRREDAVEHRGPVREPAKRVAGQLHLCQGVVRQRDPLLARVRSDY